MLHEFLTSHRIELVRRAQLKVAARPVPRPTQGELVHGIPLFVDQLIETLKREGTAAPFPADEMGRAAARHGRELLEQGVSVAQVVHDYGEVCQAVTELAGDLQEAITADEFHSFNRCLDNAIASAVSEYGRRREESLSGLEVERLGFLAHELRNLLAAVTLSFEMLQRGTVGVGGSTGRIIERSLAAMRRLVDRSLAEVRLEAGIEVKERLRLAELMEDVAVSATIEVASRSLHFTVAPVPYELFVEGDRQLLASALMNLIQNAFRFTKAGGNVSLTTRVEHGRVKVDIEDECGGLAPGVTETLFQPFAQGQDRTGLGLGLAIARRIVEAIGGELRARDLPGKGCVFTIDLPVAAGAQLPPAAP